MVLAAFMALALQAAQPPGPVQDICLTNACSKPLDPLGALRTVAEAIAAGNASRVRDLGGTPSQAMEAIFQRLNTRIAQAAPGDSQSTQDLLTNVRSFADTSDGSSLTFTNNTDFPVSPGQTVLGSVERRAPDGSVQNFWLTDNGGGIWVRPGFDHRTQPMFLAPPPQG